MKVVFKNTIIVIFSPIFVNFNIMPYKKYSNEVEVKDKSVISLLFNKKTNEYADEYGFNLDFENNILQHNSKGNIKGKSKGSVKGKGPFLTDPGLTGISYLSFWSPAYWGVNVNGKVNGKGKGKGKDSGIHELNRFYEFYERNQSSEIELMQLGTRIRCVSNY